MNIPTRQLDRVYQLIHANQLKNAELLLDAVVRVDPENMEAWMTYLMIFQSQNDLDWLLDRILKTAELCEASKAKLIDYYHYLTKYSLERKWDTGYIHRSPGASFIMDPAKATPSANPASISFEMLDIYDIHPVIDESANQKPRQSRRQRRVYNPFETLFSSLFHSIASHSLRKNGVSKVKSLANFGLAFTKDPRGTLAEISNLPSFDKYSEYALLALFLFSVRLIVTSQNFGYVLMVLFLAGGSWWLNTYRNPKGNPLEGGSRVYLSENNPKLPGIKDVSANEKSEDDTAGHN